MLFRCLQARKFTQLLLQAFHGRKENDLQLEAYDEYIKKFKSDWEAAGLFLSDEGLISEKADVLFFHKIESQGLGTLSEEPLEQNIKIFVSREAGS